MITLLFWTIRVIMNGHAVGYSAWDGYSFHEHWSYLLQWKKLLTPCQARRRFNDTGEMEPGPLWQLSNRAPANYRVP